MYSIYLKKWFNFSLLKYINDIIKMVIINSEDYPYDTIKIDLYNKQLIEISKEIQYLTQLTDL